MDGEPRSWRGMVDDMVTGVFPNARDPVKSNNGNLVPLVTPLSPPHLKALLNLVHIDSCLSRLLCQTQEGQEGWGAWVTEETLPVVALSTWSRVEPLLCHSPAV